MQNFKQTPRNTLLKPTVALGFIGLLAIADPASAQNTSYGANTLSIGGTDNVAFGLESLWNGASPTTGAYNAAVGRAAINGNTSGSNNAAMGAWSLFENTTGSGNSATGSSAMFNNISGNNNVANGYNALYSNTSGSYNAGAGFHSMYANTTGSYNTASGAYSLAQNVSGFYNAALGYQALYGNTVNNNTSIGFRSLYLSTTGPNNTAVGFAALYNNSTGSGNAALGYSADVSAGNLTNATAIGNSAVVNASNKIRLGNATVTVVEGPVAYTFSDGRYKTNVTEEVKGLEFIKKLRPVVYNLDTRKITESWTKDMPEEQRKQQMSQDFSASTAIRQTGFIAQEVEQAAKDARYDFNGVHVPVNDKDNYSIAYAEFVVPLVKGMQEQQKMIEDQQKVIDQLQQQLNELQKVQGGTTSLEQHFMSDASIEQNVPNPFSHETVIRFTLPAQVNNAFLTVYDLQGKQVKTMPIKDRGNASITFTADQLAAGMYIYSIIADGKIAGSKRMVIADR